MKLRILTVPFDPQLQAFDDEPLRTFLADKELLEHQDHFFEHQGLPYLTMVLAYRATGAAPPKPRAKTKEPRREDWRDLLEPGDMALFNTLREWRSQKAKEDGIPPYVICTNRQLAQAIRARPQTLNKLAEIEGFGSAKLKSYGAEMIAYIRREPEPAPPQEQAAESNEQNAT